MELLFVLATDLFYELHRLLVFCLHAFRNITGSLYALELIIDACEFAALWHVRR
jgi:hypothetical protein